MKTVENLCDTMEDLQKQLNLISESVENLSSDVDFTLRNVKKFLKEENNSYSDIKISEKSMRYIQDYTNRCSNELCAVESKVGKKVFSYREWLSPEHTETACMIERKEVVNQFKEFIESKIKEWHYGDSCEAKYRREMLKDLLEELKKEE